MDRFMSNQHENDHRLILHISSNTFQQQNCFVIIEHVRYHRHDKATDQRTSSWGRRGRFETASSAACRGFLRGSARPAPWPHWHRSSVRSRDATTHDPSPCHVTTRQQVRDIQSTTTTHIGLRNFYLSVSIPIIHIDWLIAWLSMV